MTARVCFFVSLIIAYVAFFLAMARSEYVAENWKGYEISPNARESIKNARNPDGVDCCGVADGIPVEYDIKQGHYWANWDGAWREIPDRKVVKNLKDVEFPIIWVTKGNLMRTNPDGTFTDLGYRDVRCFWPGVGG